jgi:excisionase family DNA binding protein
MKTNTTHTSAQEVPLMDTHEAARLLGLSEMHVRRLIASGQLAAHDLAARSKKAKKPRRRWGISRADFDAYLLSVRYQGE